MVLLSWVSLTLFYPSNVSSFSFSALFLGFSSSKVFNAGTPNKAARKAHLSSASCSLPPTPFHFFHKTHPWCQKRLGTTDLMYTLHYNLAWSSSPFLLTCPLESSPHFSLPTLFSASPQLFLPDGKLPFLLPGGYPWPLKPKVPPFPGNQVSSLRLLLLLPPIHRHSSFIPVCLCKSQIGLFAVLSIPAPLKLYYFSSLQSLLTSMSV